MAEYLEEKGCPQKDSAEQKGGNVMVKKILSIIFFVLVIIAFPKNIQAYNVQIADIGAYQFHQNILYDNEGINKWLNENISIDNHIDMVGSDSVYDRYAFNMRDNNLKGVKEAFATIGLSVNKAGFVSRILVLGARNTIGAKCIGYACKRVVLTLGMNTDEWISIYSQSPGNDDMSVWCEKLNRRIHLKRTVYNGLLACELYATNK